jgi:hypothetical protein
VAFFKTSLFSSLSVLGPVLTTSIYKTAINFASSMEGVSTSQLERVRVCLWLV